MRTLTNTLHPMIALFASAMLMLSLQARADCQEGCLTNQNTVLGDGALASAPTGTANTAIGFSALQDDTTGQENTAVGNRSQPNNVSGSRNVALGPFTQGNDGSDNTALGNAVLLANRGNGNTGVGGEALFLNSTGTANVGVGYGAIQGNFTGNGNVALGVDSLYYGTKSSNNIAFGYAIENITGNDNILIGIGQSPYGSRSGGISIGTFPDDYRTTYIAGIAGTPLVRGAFVAVGITSDGQLGVRASSACFKEAIKPMGRTSEALFALKPVTFRYKKELDPSEAPQFGLVAEEVAKVNPELVVTDNQGKPFSVRYEAVNAMLLNEFLKEHRRVESLGAAAERHQKQIDALSKGLQKLSAQVEIGRAVSPRVCEGGQPFPHDFP
jgi:hypothetical protein